MAVIRELVLPLANYPSGTRSFSRSIPDSAQSIYFEFARSTTIDPSIWPNPATTISYRQEVSFDGGTTWIVAGGFSAFGGIHVRRDGTEAPLSSFEIQLPPGLSRLWRATGTIANGPCRTSGAVELRD
jgi:hypothetical protein